jgi:hypothetical protein
MYWQIGAAWRKRQSERNKDDLLEIVKSGPSPGLIAFARDLAVGWGRLTPREPVASEAREMITLRALHRRADSVGIGDLKMGAIQARLDPRTSCIGDCHLFSSPDCKPSVLLSF